MSHDHAHHAHDHDHGSDLSPIEARVRALESLLTEKGYIDPAALDALVETLRDQGRPACTAPGWWPGPGSIRPSGRGSWPTPRRPSPNSGIGGRGGEHMVVVENTPETHNLVVCTLCSCYPWPVLGLPPVWYKSPPYRARAVIDPRGVLAEFGVTLPETTRITVWDSTAETRYMVLPDAARRDRGLRRGGARRPRHPRRHDRHRPAQASRPRRWRCRYERRPGSRRQQGFGPVVPEPDEPVFHAAWERARLRDGDGDGLHRRLEPRRQPRRPRVAAAGGVPRVELLRDLAAGAREAGRGDRAGDAGRDGVRQGARSRPSPSPGS